MPSPVSRAVLLTALGLSCIVPAVQSAHAALGGSPMTPPAGASVNSQLVSAAAVAHAASGAAGGTSTPSSYTVRATTFGNGTVVREYLATNGSVFGLAWRGPQMPNLNDLLGTYFPQYLSGVQAARAMRGGHGPVAVEQDSLVVHSGGHMGAFAGQAWLPQALPAGVSGSDIQ
ncbi:DUF2844 domain-containing protein [Paraburkholderia sp. BCC1885]|jgi:hypothetical protein|uniref:DUF2844 domain-containing protein n=1 Tax=Paraburkholderia sp. BCC1885 TaxID=2562669 RepID=UPI0011829386|nr:DUF2844 domain-containing protein [Paraburkholderia sp. BCC1885]